MGNKVNFTNKTVSIMSWCLLLISALLFKKFNQEQFLIAMGLAGVVLVLHFIIVIRELYKKYKDVQCKKELKSIREVVIQMFLYIQLLIAYIVVYKE